MANNTQQIRSIITSTKSTYKITKAMELVAAGKLGKSQERMLKSKPYTDKIEQVIRHVANSHSEYSHPYMVLQPEVKSVAYIVVSTDRGLCGGLNHQLFRCVVKEMQQWSEHQSAKIHLGLIGRKAVHFFKKPGINVMSQISELRDVIHMTDLIGVVKVILDAYVRGEIQRVYLASNAFAGVMSQKPKLLQLLPIIPDEIVDGHPGASAHPHWDYIYEPDAKSLLDVLLARYIEALVYQAVVENNACEQASRMIAMRNARENAKQIIDDLQLDYNKARQASITQELAEIVGGSEAI